MSQNIKVRISVDGYEQTSQEYDWDALFDYGNSDVLCDSVSDITGWCVSGIEGYEGLIAGTGIEDVPDGYEVALRATLDDDGELADNTVTVRVKYIR